MIGSDPQAQPFPRLARISMARVLAQLAWRMRWDLALMALICSCLDLPLLSLLLPLWILTYHRYTSRPRLDRRSRKT